MTDLAVRLLREGYTAIEHDRAARAGEASYETRLLGRSAVVLGGEEGARLFYDEGVVRRSGAVPPPLAWLLFGRGAVHGLDGHAHRARKQLFVDRLGPEQVAPCADAAARELEALLSGQVAETVAVHALLVRAYGRAVLAWSGIDVPAPVADRVSRDLAAIVAGFGFASAGTYARAWAARRRTDRWLRRQVGDVRGGRLTPAPDSALAALAAADLDDRTAAVELGNVLRPTVAVSWLGTFAVLALGLQPGLAARLAAPAADVERVAFAQEVRRTTPFVPVLTGIARRDATHGLLTLREGQRVVLDVLGIDHDDRRHTRPAQFRADRFLDRYPGPYELVPQGGGDVSGHRCPGESLTLQLLAATVAVVARRDLELVGPVAADLTCIPTLPPVGLRVRIR